MRGPRSLSSSSSGLASTGGDSVGAVVALLRPCGGGGGGGPGSPTWRDGESPRAARCLKKATRGEGPPALVAAPAALGGVDAASRAWLRRVMRVAAAAGEAAAGEAAALSAAGLSCGVGWGAWPPCSPPYSPSASSGP